MPSRRRVLSLSTLFLGGIAGCNTFSAAPEGIVDIVDIDNTTTESYTATVQIRDDEPIFSDEITVRPNIHEAIDIPTHERGAYVVEVSIEELSTTRTLDITEHVSGDERCAYPIFEITNRMTVFEQSLTYIQC